MATSRFGGVALNAALPIAALLCGLWLLELLVLRRRSGLDASRISAAATTFIAVAVLAFVAGQYPWFSTPGAPLGAQIAGLGLIVLSVVLLLAAGHRIRHMKHLQWLTWLFLACGGIFCLTEIVPGLGILSRWSDPQSVGSMFWIWLVAVGSSQALFNKNLPLSARTLCLCLALLGLYRGIVLSTSWASGWLPPLIALAVIFLFRLPRTVAGLGLLSIPAVLYLAGRINNVMMAGEQYSYVTRLEALRVLWQLFEKNPVTGFGPANYYYYTPLYPILGWYVSFSSHNNYVDILLQTGIVGLAAFGWLLYEIIRLTVNLQRRACGGFEKAYLVGSLGGICGAIASGMLADWIIPFYYNIGIKGFRSSFLFWFFLGGVVALKRIAARRAESAALPRQKAA